MTATEPRRSSKPNYAVSWTDACAFQAKIKDDLLKDGLEPTERLALTRAWDMLEERKRILRMRPKPADMPVDPAALLKALKRAKVRAGGQGSIQRLLKEAEPIIESEPDEPPAHT